MLEQLKETANLTLTENGALTYRCTLSACMDLFASIGALRNADESDIIPRFVRALAENSEIAMKTLFFARDIRGGLGERRVFRVIVRWMAENEPALLQKNLALFSEYGRWDDLLSVMETPCEDAAMALISAQLEKDMASEKSVSLLAKWLPSVNTTNREAVRMAKRIARALNITDKRYRQTLSELRRKINILENYLRERDYTFDYETQPSRALYFYRAAFMRNDGERYRQYLDDVSSGKTTMHTAALMPYDIVSKCFNDGISEEERRALDVTWNALENYGTSENALAVVDVSGSMYNTFSGMGPRPIDVAVSLGIYLAERNTGEFHNHFLTFSNTPELVEVRGTDIVEKVRQCASADWGWSTNLEAVFQLILATAVRHSLPQEELPKKLYIISDMEFNGCTNNAHVSNFENAKAEFASHGYELPEVVFWNVDARNQQVPVRMHESGTALVSGCTPQLFSMVAGGIADPYQTMLQILEAPRYNAVQGR